MRYKLITLLLAVAVIAGLVLIGCAPEAAPPPEEEPEEEEEAPPAAPEQEVFDWRLVSMWSEAQLAFQANRTFCDRLREMSSGRLDIEPFSSGALMPYTEYFDALRGGVVEIGEVSSGYFSGKDSALLAAGQTALLINNNLKMLAWHWEGGGLELISELYDKWDLHYIGTLPHGYAGESIVSRVPVRTFEDVKGLKMRMPEQMAPVWAALGADVLTIPGGEVYTALSTGLVDAADWSTPAMNFRLGFAEVCPYYSKPGDYYAGASHLSIGKKAWDSLPDDLKVMLEVAGRSLAEDHWAATAYDDLMAAENLKEAGCEMVVFEPELAAKIRELLIQETVKLCVESDHAMKIIDSVVDFIEKTKQY